MEIRAAKWTEARNIAEIFYQAVHHIDPALYTPAQQEAWAPTPPNYAVWEEKVRHKPLQVAVIESRVAGFIEVAPSGYIACLFTHPDFQGRGVASALYEEAEVSARRRQLNVLYVDASLIARPFFARRGFCVLRENTLKRRGQALRNFTMRKRLANKS